MFAISTGASGSAFLLGSKDLDFVSKFGGLQAGHERNVHDIDVVDSPCRSFQGHADVQPRRLHRRARLLNFGNLLRRTIVLLRVAPLLELLPRESGPLRQLATLAPPQ